MQNALSYSSAHSLKFPQSAAFLPLLASSPACCTPLHFCQLHSHFQQRKWPIYEEKHCSTVVHGNWSSFLLILKSSLLAAHLVHLPSSFSIFPTANQNFGYNCISRSVPGTCRRQGCRGELCCLVTLIIQMFFCVLFHSFQLISSPRPRRRRSSQRKKLATSRWKRLCHR